MLKLLHTRIGKRKAKSSPRAGSRQTGLPPFPGEKRNEPHRPPSGFSRCLFLCFLLCGGLCIPSAAQDFANAKEQGMHFGLTIGGSCNTGFPIPGAWDFPAPETKIGVAGGAYFQIDFAKRFFGHLEVGISDRKLIANGISSDTAYGNFSIDCAYTNISIPLGIGVSLFPNPSSFNASLLACAVIGLPQENKSQISVKDRNVVKRLNPVSIGAMLELRLRYEFIFIGFRYEFMATNTFKYAGQAFKTGSFGFFLGFQIF